MEVAREIKKLLNADKIQIDDLKVEHMALEQQQKGKLSCKLEQDHD